MEGGREMKLRIKLGDDPHEEPDVYEVSEMFARSVKMLLDANEKATRGSYSRGYDAGYNDLNLIFKEGDK